jgi:hypothetical protein
MATISAETMEVLLLALNNNEITQERFEIIISLLIDSLI